jgi:hypothetical protein
MFCSRRGEKIQLPRDREVIREQMTMNVILDRVKTISKAAMGIWMPNARVVCYDCHGNTFNRGFGETLVLTEAQMAKENTPVPITSKRGVTFCGDCSKAIQVSNHVAAEHNLVLALRSIGINSNMAQTGGMNSACGVNTTSGGYYLITFDFDSDGTYVGYEFDEEDNTISHSLPPVAADTPEQVIEHLQSLPNLSRFHPDGE